MSESDQKSTVLVVTQDVALLSSLLEGNTTDYQFISRESMQTALDDSELLANNDIVILDADGINGGTPSVVEQALKLKKCDPTQVLVMVGSPEPLGEILSSNIQPIIYRAFTKPIHPNQIFLAFGSASKLHNSLVQKQAAGEDLLTIGPLENRANVETISEQQKSKSVVYAAVGVLALAVIGGFLFLNNGVDSNDQAETQVIAPLPLIGEIDIVNTGGDVTKINKYNQAAATALLEARKLTPKNNNALYYYDQVLAIDPYDLTAYEGKKALAADLKSTYTTLVDAAEFDKALEMITVLQAIEPLDSSNYELRQDLETEINEYLGDLKEHGSVAEIDRMTAMMAQISPLLDSSRSAANALQKEKELLDAIDTALEQNNLIPPKADNAYALVSLALQKNLISNVHFAPRLSSLSDKLVQSAEQALAQNNLQEAETLTALIKRLGAAPQDVALLNAGIEEQRTARALEEVAVVGEKEPNDPNHVLEEIAEPAPIIIIPAKIISRAPPRYPNRALQRDIEGWVSIGFTIDTNGVPQDIAIVESEPGNTFDNAAITAVKKWRFSPAMSEDSKLPVESKVDATKLQFKID